MRTGVSEKVIDYPFRTVLFQYRDKPDKWHICCVDNGAFGWGETPEGAIRELQLTIEGQIKETFETGKNFFFIAPDESWQKAFMEAIPPSEDVRIIARFIAHLTFSLRAKAGSLRMEMVSHGRAPEPARGFRMPDIDLPVRRLIRILQGLGADVEFTNTGFVKASRRLPGGRCLTGCNTAIGGSRTRSAARPCG